MKMLRTVATVVPATAVLVGALCIFTVAHADTPKSDPEKVKELIEKIRAHRKAKEEERARKRKEWEERRARGRRPGN